MINTIDTIEQLQHQFCLKNNPFKSDLLQKNIIIKCLKALHKYKNIPNQLIALIVAFIFSSPLKFYDGCFELVYGQCNFVLSESTTSFGFTLNQSYEIQQGHCYLLGNQLCLNQKIKITKMWMRPKTCNQKKLLSYYHKYKQFILGNHLKSKGQKQNNIKRQFIINGNQTEQIKSEIREIMQTNVNLSSYHTLDLFFKLVKKNYIQIQICSQISNQKIIYVIIQGNQKKQFISGLSCDMQDQKWKFYGYNLCIWKNCSKLFYRKPTIIKLKNYKIVYCQNIEINFISEFE